MSFSMSYAFSLTEKNHAVTFLKVKINDKFANIRRQKRS